MSIKPKLSERNGTVKGKEASVWSRALTANSEWPDKDEFLDVIYWARQALGIILGIVWGIVPLKGFLGLALFIIINAGILYFYFNSFQGVDEEEYGGPWELTKEGFITSFAGFLFELIFNPSRLKTLDAPLILIEILPVLWIIDGPTSPLTSVLRAYSPGYAIPFAFIMAKPGFLKVA